MSRLDSNENMIDSRGLTETKAIKLLVSLNLPDFYLKKLRQYLQMLKFFKVKTRKNS